MLVINKLTNNSLPFIKLLSFFFGDIYFHKCEIINFRSKKYKIKPLKFQRNSKLDSSLPCYNLGDNNHLNKFVLNYLPNRFKNLFIQEFKGIDNFKDKIDISFISSLSFEELKTIYTLFKLNTNNNKLRIIHTDFHTYSCKLNGVESSENISHYYLPFDDIVKITKLIKKSTKIFIDIISNFFIKKDPDNQNTEKEFHNKVAIIIHESLSYGKLYQKSHFFSDDLKSPLHLSNVILFNRYNTNNNDAIEYLPLKISFNYKPFFQTIFLFLSKIIYIRSIKEVYGFLFVLSIYLRYKLWINTFKAYKIKNLIYDYDILVSKPLSIALEFLKIKTFAFQERPNTVFGRVDGVIVNTYFTAGKLYSNYLKNNKSFIYENSFDLGIWRQIFFNKKNLIPFMDIHFISKSKKKIYEFKNKILFLGYYFNHDNNMPCTNKIAIDNFLDLVNKRADNQKDSAIILRMKILSSFDIKYILKKTSSRNNIFICDHYDNQAVSYRLCKESDLIISTITSLALESIVYGKKVIFINNIFPFYNMAKDLYPNEFFFAIPDNSESINQLVKKCLNNDSDINNSYSNLKKKLRGDLDLSVRNIIPDTIESLLI